jgi:hypothetical protein
MKILIITFIIIISDSFFAQTLKQMEKDSIISNLDNPRWAIRSKAIIDIYQQNIPEALPILEAKIFQQEKDIALFFLLAIDKYNSSNIIPLANKFIDTVEYLGEYLTSENNNELKAEAIRILFNRGDYSKTPLLFEYIEVEKPDVAIIPFDLLPDVLKYVPEYRDQAIAELRRILLYVNDEYYSSISLIILSENLGEEFIPDLLYVMKHSNNSTLKNLAYSELEKRNYEGMEELTKQQFISDYVRAESMLLKLLTKYNSPTVYKFILENYKNVLDEKDVEFYTSSFNSTRKNARISPPTLNNLFEHFDYFVNLCDTLLNFAWLGDLNFSNELKNILTTAKTNLQNGDSLACAVQVKLFQDLVDDVYKDSLNTDPRFVTIEGWKFLYWNAQYILDRLPEIPITLPPDIQVINPAMSLVNPGSFTMEVKGTGFTTNSTVYFNGSARATTFISDSILNAQILSTDVSAAGNYPVWVNDGTTNSDTLIYKVVSTLPQPVRPVLECVRNNGDGTYTAFFGYKNDNSVSVYIPVGGKNKFTPTPQDRGQPRVFESGRHYKVFTVNFNGSNLVWTLNGRTSTASSNSAPCN